MSSTKTREEHFNFLCQMVALQLWFLWRWLVEHPEEEFSYVLRKRVDIYRRTGLYDGRPASEIDYEEPVWLRLESAARRLWEETRSAAGAARFETEGLALFRRHVEARAETDTRRGRDAWRASFLRGGDAWLSSFQCGSLKFGPPNPEYPTRVPFHIANAVSPRSIFDDPGYLPGCLLCLMEKSGRQYGADSLSTATWLNSYSRWLRLFPVQWTDNLGPEMTEPTMGMGFWGQFVNARGTFNEKHARILRDTGRFPFWPRASWCTFDQLRDHLDQLGFLH